MFHKVRLVVLTTALGLISGLILAILYGQNELAQAIIVAIAGTAAKLIESEEKTS